MKYRVAVCDDDPRQAEKLSAAVADWAAETGRACSPSSA